MDCFVWTHDVTLGAILNVLSDFNGVTALSVPDLAFSWTECCLQRCCSELCLSKQQWYWDWLLFQYHDLMLPITIQQSIDHERSSKGTTKSLQDASFDDYWKQGAFCWKSYMICDLKLSRRGKKLHNCNGSKLQSLLPTVSWCFSPLTISGLSSLAPKTFCHDKSYALRYISNKYGTQKSVQVLL